MLKMIFLLIQKEYQQQSMNLFKFKLNITFRENINVKYEANIAICIFNCL